MCELLQFTFIFFKANKQIALPTILHSSADLLSHLEVNNKFTIVNKQIAFPIIINSSLDLLSRLEVSNKFSI